MHTSHDAPNTTPRAPYWGDDAACKDANPDNFFPDSYRGIDAFAVQAAKKVCARCPVADACLHAALERRETEGVWGGLDPDERRELLRPPPELAPAGEAAPDGPA